MAFSNTVNIPALRKGLDTGATAMLATQVDGLAPPTARGAALREETGVGSSDVLDAALSGMTGLTPGQAAERDRLLGRRRTNENHRREDHRSEDHRSEDRSDDFEARFARAFPEILGGGGRRREWMTVKEPGPMEDDDTQGGWTARGV